MEMKKDKKKKVNKTKESKSKVPKKEKVKKTKSTKEKKKEKKVKTEPTKEKRKEKKDKPITKKEVKSVTDLPVDAKATEMNMAHFLAEARYDFQQTRLRSKNRLRSLLIREIEGWGFEVPEKKEDDEKSHGVVWNDNKLMDKIQEGLNMNKINPDQYEYIMKIWKASDKFEVEEKEYQKLFVPYCTNWAIFKEWLSKIKGIGYVHALNLYYLYGNCEKFETVAKLWAYTGYHVIDGQAVRRTKGQKSNWNTYAKSKCWNIVQSFIRAKNCYYNKVYLPEKVRAEKNHPDWTKLHIHNHSQRYTAKMFLAHYWLLSRQSVGLPVRSPYAIEKLGHTTEIMPMNDEKV